MMDIYRQAEAILRAAGYDTYFDNTGPTDFLIFEDNAVMGFLHVFPNAKMLVAQSQAVEKEDLTRYAIRLRSAPSKAWNVYCVFLTQDAQFADVANDIDRIEEDLASTRKIARAGVVSPSELEQSLLPLLPLQMLADFSVTNYEIRLRPRLAFLPRSVADAIIAGDEPAEIARQAIEGP